MPGNPTVSVLLRTYDSEAHVERSLRSVLNQSLPDLEVLVLDGGSTDDTLDIVSSVSDERVHTYSPPGGLGLVEALNAGLERSSGRYVAIQDADDYSHPERFARQVSRLDADPEVAMVGTGARLLEEDGRVRARRRVLESVSGEDLFAQNRFVHGSVMYRRDDALTAGGYDEFFELSEDYEFYLRLSEQGALVNIDEPLYHLYLRTGSAYASDLERTKLYARLARGRYRGEFGPETRRRVEKDGILSLRDYLDHGDLADHELAVAMELLRYGQKRPARARCRAALSARRRSPMAVLLFLLSLFPKRGTDGAVFAYRQLKNARIRRRNRP